MNPQRRLTVVDVHAEGESGKVVLGGIPRISGSTTFEKMKYFEEHLDSLRTFLLCEPRGAVWHNANVILPSEDPSAEMGYIILESTEYPAMSGSNTMCVATVLLETGVVPMQEPITRFALESPAGKIDIEAQCSAGKAQRIRLTNQPAFVYYRDAFVDVPGLGEIVIDVAYGGMTYAIVDADSIGLRLHVDNEAQLLELGQRVKKAAAEQLHVRHPANPQIPGITNTSFTGSLTVESDETGNEILTSTNAVVVSPGRLDRSPCGTGTSARVALLYARGLLKQGQTFRHRSLIGSHFDASFESTTSVGTLPAVIPSISGRAWITAYSHYVLDPSDPYPDGFTVGKPWKAET